MVDSSHQFFHIVLHLFHGLVKCGVLSRGALPLLDLLHEKIATCKAVWGGALPEREHLVYCWWIGYRLKINCTKDWKHRTLEFWQNMDSANQLNAPNNTTYCAL
jgi:hypothetical protein